MVEVLYRCPSCGSTDPVAYVRCQRSGCPDGRDPRPDNRVADLERQIAELRAKVDVQRQSKEYAQRCCEKAEAENARLRALPLKDEVERVLEEVRKNTVAIMKALMATGSRDNLLLADAVHRADDAARALLSRLRAGEQEGWRTMESAPKDGTRILVYRRRPKSGSMSKNPAIGSWNGLRAGGARPGWELEIKTNTYLVSNDALFGWQPLPASPSVSDGGSRG